MQVEETGRETGKGYAPISAGVSVDDALLAEPCQRGNLCEILTVVNGLNDAGFYLPVLSINVFGQGERGDKPAGVFSGIKADEHSLRGGNELNLAAFGVVSQMFVKGKCL